MKKGLQSSILLMIFLFSMIICSHSARERSPPSIWSIVNESSEIKRKSGEWANATVISDGFKGIYWNKGTSAFPDIAVDDNGIIHVVWLDTTGGPWSTDAEIMYANYSRTTGWSNATVISDGYQGYYWNTGDSGNPAVAVSINGTIHVVWEDETNGTWGIDTEIMYVNYTAGRGWSNATVISDGYKGKYWNTGESTYPDIGVDGTGTVHVVWYDKTGGKWGTDPEIMYVNYTSSKGWSNATVISDGYKGYYWNNGDSAVPAIAITEGGALHVVWFDNTIGKWGNDYEIMYVNYTSNKGWSNTTVISDGYKGYYWNTGFSLFPAIAASSDNTIHVVWSDLTPGIWGTDIEVMYVNYTLGVGWSNATVISDGYDGRYWSTDTSGFPDIAVESNGTVHVVWEEYTAGEWGTDTEIMYANYIVGRGWSNGTLVSDGYNNRYWNTGTSLRPAIALDNRGPVYVHVVWEDDTPGKWGSDSEIMYSCILPPPPQSPLLMPLTNIGAQVLLNWTYVAGAITYYIYRNSSLITSITGLIPINMTNLNYSVDNIPTSGIYYYAIVATNLYANSSISNCENLTIILPLQSTILHPIQHLGLKAILNWTQIPGASVYYIYRNTSKIISTMGLSPIKVTSLNSSEDLVPSAGTYYYVIVASNLYVNSSISNCENITIILPPQPPSLQPLMSAGYKIFLNWSYIPDATIYYIFRNTTEITSTGGLIPIGVTALNHSEDTVSTSGIYYYVIIAGNAAGNSSISNCEIITILLPAPMLSPLSNVGAQIFLNWTHILGATIYYIYRATTEITSTIGLTPIGVTALNHSEDTVSTSGTYYFVIVASNFYGNGSRSNCENITITLPPQPPTLQPLENVEYKIFLNWSQVSGASNYYIYRNTTKITSTIGLTPIGMTSLNHTEDIVSLYGTYYYVIVAENAAGNSSISNCENITISPETDGNFPNLEWIYFVIIPLLIVIPISLIYRRRKKKTMTKEKKQK